MADPIKPNWEEFDDEEILKNIPEGWQGSTFHSTSTPFPTFTVKPQRLPEKKSNKEVELICLADVKPEPISWLWEGRIALGKLTLIAGDPGLGKSLISATLAAAVSRGFEWPVDGTRAPLGDVVLLSAEDDPADTIRPRLDAAEADCARIRILKSVRSVGEDGVEEQRSFSLRADVALLEETLSSLPECRMVVIDPISAYLDGTDSHNNADIRGLLAPLSDLASRLGVAIVLIHHLNKNSSGSAMYRTMGSLAFVAAVRAAYVVTKDKDNPDRRLVMPIKNNLAKDGSGLAYSVVAVNDYPVIAWEKEAVTMTADEALAPSDSAEERTDTDWAVLFLEDTLAEGPLPAVEVKKLAKQAGITDKPLRSARQKLKVRTIKSDFAGGWVWSLPNQEALQTQDAPPGDKGTLDDLGHLGETQ